jgi:ribonuclease VapC
VIVDSSALVALAAGEQLAGRLLWVLETQSDLSMSTTTYLETCLVLDRRADPVLARRMQSLISELPIRLEPFTAEQAQIARTAYRDFGKGSGHPARLDFGDCFSYALAIDTDRPLLFVGNDFNHTDVRVAAY